VLSTLQATKASRTSGEAPGMLSLENDMGFFNGGGFVGWFMSRFCSDRFSMRKKGLILTG
jgi:hypothetical protein